MPQADRYAQSSADLRRACGPHAINGGAGFNDDPPYSDPGYERPPVL